MEPPAGAQLIERNPAALGHSPDPDDAFMFYGLAKDPPLIETARLAVRARAAGHPDAQPAGA